MARVKMAFALPLILVMLLIGLFWYRLGEDPRKLPSALLNKPVPEFKMTTLTNKTFNEQMFKGKVSVLTVWATWCGGCRAEHPLLMDIAIAKHVNLVGLNYKDSRQAAVRWLHQYGNPYSHVLYDPQGQVAMQLGVYGTPETYLIDQQGVIRYKHIGPLDQSIWQCDFAPRIKRLHL